MKRRRLHRPRDERGASLILAIAFMLVAGTIGVAVVSSVTSALNDRVKLDAVRDRQYAADGAVEFAITQVRQIGGSGPALDDCGGPYFHALNDVAIRVDCANAQTAALGADGLLLQRDVIFSACPDAGVACSDATTVVRAQVNFEDAGSGVTRTYVQSWSVNR